MLNPYELQVFLAAEVESFSAAARRLHLTQSAVSQQIHSLEQQAIDFGSMSGRIEHPDLVFDEFMQDDLVLIAPVLHPLARQEVISPERLDVMDLDTNCPFMTLRSA